MTHLLTGSCYIHVFVSINNTVGYQGVGERDALCVYNAEVACVFIFFCTDRSYSSIL